MSSKSIKNVIQAIRDSGERPFLATLFNAIRADLAAVRAPLAGLLTGSATYDAANLVDGSGATSTITVTGAALGDYVVGISCSVDLQGMTLTAYVSAADTVSFRLQNESGGAVDLASATFRAVVLPRSTFAAPAALTTLE